MNTEIQVINNVKNNMMEQGFTNEGVHFIRHFLILKGLKNKNTAISYERDILDYFKYNVDIESITPRQIKEIGMFESESYLKELMTKGYASATVYRKIASLSSLFKWLCKYQDNGTGDKFIHFDPFGTLNEMKPTLNSKETEYLTQEECRQILNVFDTEKILDLRNKAIMSLALTTALRKSEMINIKLSDVTMVDEYNVVFVMRKGGKNEYVRISDEVKSMIDMYVERTGRSYETHSNEYLFIGHSNKNMNTDNTRLDASTLNYMIKSVCKKTGITKALTVHGTRHTAITLAIKQGNSIETVRDFANHSNISTTDRYIHSMNKLANSPQIQL